MSEYHEPREAGSNYHGCGIQVEKEGNEDTTAVQRQQDQEFKRLLDSSISRITQKRSSKRLGWLKLRVWRITINNFKLQVQTEFAPFPSEICSPLLFANHPSRKLIRDLFTVCI